MPPQDCIVVAEKAASPHQMQTMYALGSNYAPLAMRSVRSLIAGNALKSHFQPIADLAAGTVYGHEALIRGPERSPLAMPDALFAAAAALARNPAERRFLEKRSRECGG